MKKRLSKSKISIKKCILIFLSKKKFLKFDTKFWGNLFIISLFMDIYDMDHRKMDSKGLFKEMEEAFMKETIKNNESINFYFFWSWENKKYDYYDNEKWNLRLQMMKYHYSKCMNVLIR